MEDVLTPRGSAARLGGGDIVVGGRGGEAGEQTRAGVGKTVRQSMRRGEQREVEEEEQSSEKWQRKLEGKGELHHLSRAKPRREAVLTSFFPPPQFFLHDAGVR